MSALDFQMFLGTYTPKLDNKGRLFLPAKFRPRLAAGVVLTRGQERCIYGWTHESFAAFTDRVRQAPVTNMAARNFSRMLFSGASDEKPDSQGRVSVPAVLREWAELDRECVVVGALERIEIWDAERWATFQTDQEQAFSEMSEDVMPGL